MKNLILFFALVISFTSCTKQASNQLAPMAKGNPHHNSGGGSNTVPQVTGLSATQTSSGVYLQWNAVTNATAYWIYRNNYVGWIVNSTSYTDGSATPGTYTYQVAAVVNSTLGPKSSSVTITIQ